MLEYNCRTLRKENRLTALKGFISVRDGEATIDRELGTLGYRLREITDAGGTVEKIRCLSMGTLMKECHIDKIDLLKCDIEGAEAAVFGQCAPWINRVRHIAVETHRPYLPEDLLADLARNGGDFEMQQNTVSTQHHVCFLANRSPG